MIIAVDNVALHGDDFDELEERLKVLRTKYL